MRFYVVIGAIIGVAASCPRLSPAASARIEAGYRLKACLKSQSKAVCLAASNVYCRSQGLEDNCGVDELWSDPNYYSPSR
jgi:hypothetical protein